jgi:hypothetical protein
VVLALTPHLPARYAAPHITIRSAWQLHYAGDRAKRHWVLVRLTRKGGFATTPPMLPAPSGSELQAARQTAGRAVTAAFTVASHESPASYDGRQPDVYLTAAISDDEARTKLGQDLFGSASDALSAYPPMAVKPPDGIYSDFPLTGTAYDAAEQLVTQARNAGSDQCFGDVAVSRVAAIADAWQAPAIESRPLADLQRITLRGRVQLTGRTTCTTTQFFGPTKVTRKMVTTNADVSVVLVRPHVSGVDAHWRVQTLTEGSEGDQPIYAAQG